VISKLKNFWKHLKDKKLIVAVILVFVVAGLAWLFWHILNSPSYGEIKVASSSPNSKLVLPEYTTLQNDYFTLDYSKRYTAVPVEVGGGDVAYYKLVAQPKDISADPLGEIEVILRLTPDGGVTLDKDYQLYSKDTKNYRMFNKYYHGEAIDIAAKTTGGTDQIALWLHGKYLLAVKVHKKANQAQLDSELKDILTSVQWLKN
jgi:hypothetical protein